MIGKLKKGTIIIKILKPYKKHLDNKLTMKEVANDLQNITKLTIEEIKKTYIL